MVSTSPYNFYAVLTRDGVRVVALACIFFIFSSVFSYLVLCLPYDLNLTASANTTFANAYSNFNLVGLVILLVAGFLLVCLTYTPFFRFLRQRGKRVFRVFYYFLIGIPAFIGGFTVYRMGVLLSSWASDSGITWVDIGNGIGAFALVSVVGYVSEKVYRRILDNFAKARTGELDRELEN